MVSNNKRQRIETQKLKDSKAQAKIFGDKEQIKKITTRTKNINSVYCSIEDLFNQALNYLPPKFGDMYLSKYSKEELLLLKNYHATAANLLHLISLTSKARIDYEKEQFKMYLNKTLQRYGII